MNGWMKRNHGGEWGRIGEEEMDEEEKLTKRLRDEETKGQFFIDLQ
jgi:4-hydroxy-L-threonine phosphate dehydrogenase PdxA